MLLLVRRYPCICNRMCINLIKLVFILRSAITWQYTYISQRLYMCVGLKKGFVTSIKFTNKFALCYALC